jgi:ABC-type lipoprotein export system ATPase subunit
MTLMKELNRRDGLTFVLVTHDLGIGTQTDRIVSMRDGRIVDQTSKRFDG